VWSLGAARWTVGESPARAGARGYGLEVSQPDIVLVMTDQQRHDQVGWASGDHFLTPNLDRLAARSTVFDRAYSAATVCIPARVSLMTGLPAHRVPVEPGTDAALGQGAPTVARTLRAAGYQTALVGKMHFWPVNADHGFELMRTCEHLFPRDFTDGRVTVPEATDDYHRDLVAHGLVDWRSRAPGAPKEDASARPHFAQDAAWHPTNWVAREAVEVLARRDPDRPLFLVVSFPHPHEPHNPPEPYASMFDPADSILPDEGFEVNDTLPQPFLDAMGPSSGPWSAVRVPSAGWLAGSLATVRGLVHHIDDAVGSILARLDLDRSLVVFTSDHGDYAGHRGLVRKIPWIAFDDLARVPLLVSGPDAVGGQRRGDLVQSSDFALTCLDYAGLEPDPDAYEGRSLRPVVEGGPDPEPERPLFLSTSIGWTGVRRGRYKYLGRRNPYFPARGLFDLDDDPGETCDVADDPAHAGVADELEHLLDEELARPCP
jgi:arylsulfatase